MVIRAIKNFFGRETMSLLTAISLLQADISHAKEVDLSPNKEMTRYEQSVEASGETIKTLKGNVQSLIGEINTHYLTFKSLLESLTDENKEELKDDILRNFKVVYDSCGPLVTKLEALDEQLEILKDYPNKIFRLATSDPQDELIARAKSIISTLNELTDSIEALKGHVEGFQSLCAKAKGQSQGEYTESGIFSALEFVYRTGWSAEDIKKDILGRFALVDMILRLDDFSKILDEIADE